MTLSAVVSIDMFDCGIVEGKSEFGSSMQGDGLEDIIPATGRLKNYFINDFQINLPYDHSYLSENLLDPAHIPISHDATEGGGKRENAQPYEMIVDKDSLGSNGFTRWLCTVTARDTDGPFTEVSYVSPGIVCYRNPRSKNGMHFGAALHCMLHIREIQVTLPLICERVPSNAKIHGFPKTKVFVVSHLLSQPAFVVSRLKKRGMVQRELLVLQC